MKKLLPFLIVMHLMLMNISCSKKTTEPHTAYVSGTAAENFRNKKIYLQYILEDSLQTDTTIVDSEGSFDFEITGIAYPVHALLTNDLTTSAPKVKPKNRFEGVFTFQFGSPSAPVNYGQKKDARMFALEEGTLTFDITDSIYNSQLQANSFNQQLEVLHEDLNEVMGRYNRFKETSGDYTTITDFKKLDSLDQVYNEIWQDRKIVYRDYILSNPNSVSSLFALYLLDGGVNMDVLRYYDLLDDSVKNSAYGATIKKNIEKYRTLVSGRPNESDIIKNFQLQDQDGKEVELYDVASRFIFIDFWATWCGPCRVENRAISEFYEDYSPEDFQMIGISIDEKEDVWTKALQKDNVKWISLHDEDKIVNDGMGITSYPTNFLLDQNFKVIASQLDSKELKAKLDELLKQK